MGVPRFFGFISHHPLFKEVVLRHNPGNIDFFYIDGNGLLHTVVGQVFNLEAIRESGVLVVSEQELMQKQYEVFRRYWEAVVALCQTVRPRRSLGLVIDGVGPQAKITQQRGRRYQASFERQQKPEIVFDRNSITPGTQFMFQLDAFLRREIDRIKNLTDEQRRHDPQARNLPPHILYSSHLVPGEGEHKIADLIRETPANNQTVAVHGMDADLFMIYLMRLKQGWANIYLFRENTLNYHVETMVDLKTLSNIITGLYQGVADPIDDFVTLIFLIGNDFLPHFPIFERTHDGLQTLIGGYREFIQETQSPGLTTGSGINWQEYGKFLEFISTRYNGELLNRWGTNADGKIRFPHLVAQSCITRTRQVVGTETTCNAIFNVEKFRDEWYRYAFSPKTGLGVVTPTIQDVNVMIKTYLEGIAWIYNYYRNGVRSVNVAWYYPYYYTPVFSDLYRHIQAGPVDWEVNPLYIRSDFVSPLVQMAMVIPAGSYRLTPQPLWGLYTENSSIYDLMPTEWKIDNQGKQEEWEGFPILPFPNRTRVIRAVAALQLPSEYMAVYEPQQNYSITTDIEAAFRVYRGRGEGRGRGRGEDRGRGGYRGRGEDRGRGGSRGGFRGRGEDRGRGGYRGRGEDRGRGGYRGRGEGSSRGTFRGRGEGSSRGTFRGRGEGSSRGRGGPPQRFQPAPQTPQQVASSARQALV